MQDKILKILKIKMDAINRNIDNLNYLNGELDRDAISIMENSETRDEEILGAVMDGNMPLSDVVYLYLNNTLTIEELEDATEFSQTDFDFSTCIDENTDFSYHRSRSTAGGGSGGSGDYPPGRPSGDSHRDGLWTGGQCAG